MSQKNAKFYCPECRVKLDADTNLFGMQVKCPGCSSNIKVPSPSINVGEKFQDFTVERWLSQGAMGEIYLLRDEKTKEKFALKVLPKYNNTDRKKRRFFQESNFHTTLNHPSIIKGLHSGIKENTNYYIMEYFSGESLDIILKRNKIFPEKTTLKIALTVAIGLEYAWNQFGIIHRDIKPANIMMDNQNNVKIFDFGLAKSITGNAVNAIEGRILGTPLYVSPEQIKKADDVEISSDIYSLGATMYHLAVGQPPFDGKNSKEVLSKIFIENVNPPHVINKNLSEKFSILLMNMLEKKVENRLQDWRQVVFRIMELLK